MSGGGVGPRPAAIRSSTVINGETREAERVTTERHVIEAVELDMAEQWDFMELAGENINNRIWVNTALLAAAVISIDGVPQPVGPKTRDGIRQILKKIGISGVEALHAAFEDDRPEIEQRNEMIEAAAGN